MHLILIVCASIIIFGSKLILANTQARQKAALSAEAVQLRGDVTGGSSYPDLVIQNAVAPLRFLLWNRGNSPLRDVTVTVERSSFPRSEYQTQYLGAIPAGGSREVPFQINPVLDVQSPYVDRRPIDSWIFNTYAANGHFSQQIQFRRTIECQEDWESRTVYW